MTDAVNGQAGCMMRPVRTTPFHPAQDLAALVRLRSDLRAEGLSDNQITRLVRSGVLHRVRHGTYVAGDIWTRCSVEDRHRLLARGVLARAHPSTVLTHVSSVAERDIPMWGLNMGVVHTTRGQSDRAGRHASDWTPHRGVLADEDIEVVNGVPVSTAARAAFEVLTVAAVEPALVVVNRLLHAGRLTLPALADQVAQHQRWPGSLTADLVLRLADPRLESVGEDRFIYLVYRQGLPRPEPQFEVFDESGNLVARVDFAWPELGVFLEFDGREKYTRYRLPGETLEDYLMREKRRAELVCLLTGWTCLRISWSDLLRPELLASRIRGVMAARARRGA